MFAENFTPQDEDAEKFINVGYLLKKMFSAPEKLQSNRIYHILGKIKTGLIMKRMTPDDIFTEMNAETGNPNDEPNHQITKDDFIKKLKSLKINMVDEAGITHLGHFLSTVNMTLKKTPFISLSHFQHVLRKLRVSDQHTFVQSYEELTKSAKKILAQSNRFK